MQLDADSTSVDPAELKALTNYFHAALVKALEPRYPVVNEPGPNIMLAGFTLMGLVFKKPEVSLAALVMPDAMVPDLVVSAASRVPTGSAPDLGGTGIAPEFIDGAGCAAFDQFADTNFGRKLVLDQGGDVSKTVSGTVDSCATSFSTWGYAQPAFDG